MKCERCSGYAETVADVRGCVNCVQDGTAAQIAPEIADNTVLESLCLPDTGLANRFKRGSLPAAPAANDEDSIKEIETKTYADGTQATGVAPLPEVSPNEQQDAGGVKAAPEEGNAA